MPEEDYRMRAWMAQGSPEESRIKAREITFIGMRVMDGREYCLLSATQMWSDWYFMELDAKNAGPLGTAKGTQMKLLIPYSEVLAFLKHIEQQAEAELSVLRNNEPSVEQGSIPA